MKPYQPLALALLLAAPALAANLTDEERTRFVIGNSFFKRNWVQAPASTKARDGLGPHFIARSCGGCHAEDGRGAPPKPGEQPVGLLLRLSIPGVGAHGGVVPEPTYGDQFNVFAVRRVKPEGQVDVGYTEVPGRFADGEAYTLLAPATACATWATARCDPTCWSARASPRRSSASACWRPSPRPRS